MQKVSAISKKHFFGKQANSVRSTASDSQNCFFLLPVREFMPDSWLPGRILQLQKTLESKSHTVDVIIEKELKNTSCPKKHPRCSMYGIFTYIYPQNYPNVDKYTIHWASGHITDGKMNAIAKPFGVVRSGNQVEGKLWKLSCGWSTGAPRYSPLRNKGFIVGLKWNQWVFISPS